MRKHQAKKRSCLSPYDISKNCSSQLFALEILQKKYGKTTNAKHQWRYSAIPDNFAECQEEHKELMMKEARGTNRHGQRPKKSKHNVTEHRTIVIRL